MIHNHPYCVCLSIDAVAAADPHTTHSTTCKESILGPCRCVDVCPRLQHHRCPLPGAAAGLCVPSQTPVCYHRSRTLHRVRDTRLPLRGCRAVCSHGQTTHAARRVCPQRKVPSALLGQKLCRVAAVLFPSAELCTQGPAAVGGERQAPLAGYTECRCPPFKGGTERAD